MPVWTLWLLVACTEEVPLETGHVAEVEACAVRVDERQLFWGDVHVHTAHSFDAWVYDVRTTPDDAYRFAKGEALLLPDAQGSPVREVRLGRPLDFAAVTDHSEFLTEVAACTEPGSAAYDSSFCVGYREANALSIQAFGTSLVPAEPKRLAICEEADLDCTNAASDVWARHIEAAEAHYDRSDQCSFTSFIGYEWSGATNVSNFHRNVLFASGDVPELPISYFEAPTPEALWRQLSYQCARRAGCDVLAIPHNPNYSNGQQFTPVVPPGEDPAAWNAYRARMEPLLELYQHKGAAECYPSISGILGAVDEQCDFEQVRLDAAEDCGDEPGAGAMAGFGCVHRLDTARGILLEGLRQARETGENPYLLGFVANTDTHSGTPGLVREAGWEGHLGALEANRDERLGLPGLNPGGIVNSPGGLMAVWAEENRRSSLFAAMRRREAYGTSGPRIVLRVFGGASLPLDLCDDPDFVATADELGVPMGGVLEGPSQPMRIAFLAQRDPGGPEGPGAMLERVQVVKQWLDGQGQGRVEVYDVAGGDRDATPDGCAASDEGYATLCGVWEDPDWESGVPAAYYVRVLENPTCRWSTEDCAAEEPQPDTCARVPRHIQERAWSSPIWTE